MKYNEILDKLNDTKTTVNYYKSDVDEIKELSNRELYLSSEIDDYSCEIIVNAILDFNRQDKDIPIDERNPIKIYLTTCGGSVVDGYRVIDAILQSKTPVYTINTGYWYSMGFLIGIAGKKRFATQNSTFLLHDGSGFAWDSSSKMHDRLEFDKLREKRIKNYVLAQTGITEDLYEKNLRVEWYMFADTAKELKIIDNIVGEDCDIDEIL